MYKELFKTIKEELLKDENIYEVSINSSNKTITIKPIQNKAYFNNIQPLENFLNEEGEIYIQNKQFKIKEWEHFNTTIYKIVLKMVGTGES